MRCLRGKPDRRDISRHARARARVILSPFPYSSRMGMRVYARGYFCRRIHFPLITQTMTHRFSLAAVEISIRESIGVGNAATTSRLHYRNYRFSLVSRKQDPCGRGVREYSGIIARSTWLQHVTQEIGNYRFHPPPPPPFSSFLSMLL